MAKIYSLEGTWGVGKTSILKCLENSGHKIYYSVVKEIYRDFPKIRPKTHPIDFTELFLLKKQQQLKDAISNENKFCFIDRSLFAPIALRRLLGLNVPQRFYDSAINSGVESPIIVVEQIPFEKLYEGWGGRHFSYEDATKYQEITIEVIQQCRFSHTLIPPDLSPEERAEVIINKLELG